MTAAPEPLTEPLYVSRPALPPIDSYVSLLSGIWESDILTNLGPLHQRFERAIADRVGYEHVSLWNNGTNALLGALSQLDLHDEVIVTPFTFPATVHAIATLGLTPVFADVDPVRMTISPESILERLTQKTSAIVGTHLYGISCDTQAINAIATEHSLRVVYDGAHSFGRHAPIFESTPGALGDATMVSLHATKLLHAVEGGVLVTEDAELHRKFTLARNFGIRSETENEGIGLNGKLSEFHAAMGLLVLDEVDREIDRRALLANRYGERLAAVEGLDVVAGLDESRQYLVLRVRPAFGSSREDLHASLRSMNVFSRRYFHPLCSDLEPYADLPSSAHLPHARLAADECLVLPLHGSMSLEIVDFVCDIVDWHRANFHGAKGGLG